MNFYDKVGYLDFEKVLKNSSTFNFICGGRGTGKTFSALKYVYENEIPFIFIRAMKNQIETVATELLNPFKPLEHEYGYNVKVQTIIKNVRGFYDVKEDESGIVNKKLIGIAVALSDFSSLRGIDVADYDCIIFDEFIPKEGEVVRGNWGRQLADFYETANRNRELSGRDPIKVFCLANSNNIANSVFFEFGLMKKAIDMSRNKQTYAKMEGKEKAVFFLGDSPISRKKVQTALYKALGDNSDYADMAIENIFEGVDSRGVKSLPYNQLRPLIRCGELCVYDSQYGFYISDREFMKMESVNLATFKRWYSDVVNSILFDHCIYESINSKVLARAFLRIQ